MTQASAIQAQQEPPPIRRLEGKAALVTGGARGIGQAIARRLAAEGADVALLDLSPDVIHASAELGAAFRVRSLGLQADVTQKHSVESAIQQAVEAFGRLDIAANNAGVVQPMLDVVDTEDELVDQVISVNLRGVFNCARAAARQMVGQKSGTIINMGSWFGKTGHAGFAVYCATKAAVINLTQTLALELAPFNVTVNCVCPGNVDTEMHWRAIRDEAQRRGITYDEMCDIDRQSIPLGRVASTDDIAAAYAYLASADGAYLTGQAINVNGGIEFH